MRSLSAFLFFLLSPAAWAGNGFGFPVCMYGVSSPSELAPLKAAGFNCFQTYEAAPEKLAALAEAARPLGLRLLAAPDKVLGSSYAEAAKDWPMLAWYLCDEPEVQKLPLAEMQRREKAVKDWHPAAPTAFVMGKGIAAFTYGSVADALMVDWYPVPHLETGSVGTQVALLRQAADGLDKARPGKPVWAVLQAFDWLEHPQRRKPPVGGFPTLDQVRLMTYLSVLRGASGVFYFMLRDKAGKALYEHPGRWAFFEKTVAELNALLPALDGGRRLPPPDFLDPRLAAGVVKGGGRTILIMANPAERPVRVLPEKLSGWRPLFEPHRDPKLALYEYKGNWWLMPGKTLVFEKRRKFLLF